MPVSAPDMVQTSIQAPKTILSIGRLRLRRDSFLRTTITTPIAAASSI
ncbi:MAG: hypothetical protein J5509_10585 [Lachnospiraceae bacterium]|nr:hypothetical protein [Lachnospiraceae bacterium]